MKNKLSIIYWFNVNNRSTRTMCEICSKLTKKKTKTPEQREWLRSGVFIINFEQISKLLWCLNFWSLKSECQLGKWTIFLGKNLNCFKFILKISFRSDVFWNSGFARKSTSKLEISKTYTLVELSFSDASSKDPRPLLLYSCSYSKVIGCLGMRLSH